MNDRRKRTVYIAKANDGTVLYVGQTVNFRKRVHEHRWSSSWCEPGVFFVADSEVFGSEEAVEREAELIRQLRPVHNRNLNQPQPPQVDQSDGIPLREAAELLGWTRSKMYRVVRCGEIRELGKWRGRTIVDRSDVERQLRVIGGAA